MGNKREPFGIKIKGTLQTELCQIEGSGLNPLTKKNEIYIKKQKVLVENVNGVKKPVRIPFFSGNSFRSKLRRAATEILLQKGREKGFTIKNPMDFHLMNAGGGNDFQKQPYDIEDKVRELNPVLSVFGASLALVGKIVTPNLIPYRFVDSENGIKEYYVGENEEDGTLYSTIEFDDTFYKKDDILDRAGNAKYLSPELIQEWQEAVEDNQKAIAKNRNSGGDKNGVKKESIRSALLRKFIVRGTDFYTSLSEVALQELTPIERGLVYKALEKVVLMNLGSNIARDFGKFAYTISFADGSELVTYVDEYNVTSIVKADYKGEVKESIKAFEQWLENDFTEEAFKVSETLR